MTRSPSPAPRPRRALIVSHHGLPHVGGVEVLVDAEIRTLLRAGWEVTHVTSDLLGQAQVPEYERPVRIIRVPAWHVMERRVRLAYPFYSPRLWSVLRREVQDADVVHAHGFIFLSSVAALLLARAANKPRMLSDHGGVMQFPQPLFNGLMGLAAALLGRITCRLAQKRVAYNQRVLGDLDRLAGGRGRSLFLPYPTDRQLFHPASPDMRHRLRRELGWPNERPVVLFVGRITADKGVLLLLEALTADHDLVFVGPGNPDILALPRTGVTYLPPRPQSEVVKLYQAADLVVLPSRPSREGFPLVVREALACGLKVVMTYEPGYEPYRVLANLHFTESTPAALRQAIATALAAPLAPDPPAAALLHPTPEQWLDRLYNDMVA
ncbi:MAG TPA: glycosyltransferase family 4 protein [Gemmatales bacterium]|nr:glycosyltransferase family 4 protein [Gemmatales bacterium]HMP58067.1 glycosyltransferase family 4 protein [Gemmatales bacterium]